ncbi:MAG: hypothetical protein HKL90_07725 [Elusimicrobia bacterium]|nr:hypothetical protein [Elusimicrobiota bacterium]
MEKQIELYYASASSFGESDLAEFLGGVHEEAGEIAAERAREGVPVDDIAAELVFFLNKAIFRARRRRPTALRTPRGS